MLIFLAAFSGFSYGFYSSGTALWESVLAAGLYAAALSFFALLCLASRAILAIFLIGTLVLTFVLHHFGSNGAMSNCPVTTFCFDFKNSFLTELFSTSFRMVILVDVSAGLILGIIFLLGLISRHPRALYFTGGSLHGLFVLLLSLLQVSDIPSIPAYSPLQWVAWGIFLLMALGSFCLGLFYKKIKPDPFKRIYGAVMMGSLILLPLLAPLAY